MQSAPVLTYPIAQEVQIFKSEQVLHLLWHLKQPEGLGQFPTGQAASLKHEPLLTENPLTQEVQYDEDPAQEAHGYRQFQHTPKAELKNWPVLQEIKAGMHLFPLFVQPTGQTTIQASGVHRFVGQNSQQPPFQ